MVQKRVLLLIILIVGCFTAVSLRADGTTAAIPAYVTVGAGFSRAVFDAPAGPDESAVNAGPHDATGPRLERLAWMTGYWTGSADGTGMEEIWLAPGGGVMLGLHRDVSGSSPAFFEFLRIIEEADGIFYEARPMGGSPTRFRLIESADGKAVFENAEHDFPQRIIYRMRKDGKLRARIEGKIKDEIRASEWTWSRTSLTGRSLNESGNSKEGYLD